ncbi:MAG: hypothetical protein P1U34_06145 [Coxiellaceae bacterium]|nr:hypothetical protein [Coxiellaceae bacterium]
MFKIKQLICLPLVALTLHSAYAVSAIDQQQRIQVVKDYLGALAHANVREMLPLFAPDAKLYTDSNGYQSPTVFFPNFFGKIKQSMVALDGIYVNPSRPNELSANFRFQWIDYQSQTHSGSFDDAFLFAANNNLLKEVNMQEKI